MSLSSTAEIESGDAYLRRKAREEMEAAAAKKAHLRSPGALTPGHEVDVESVITRTKKGTPAQNSHLGKLVALCEEHGWTLKAGAADYFTGDKIEKGEVIEGRIERLVWLQGAHAGRVFTFTSDVCTLNGLPIPFKELCIVIDSTEKEDHGTPVLFDDRLATGG